MAVIVLASAVGVGNAAADGVEPAIELLEDGLAAAEESCVPRPADVTRLLTALRAAGDDVDRIRGLRWLSTMPFWDADARRGGYWGVFLGFSEDSQTYAVRYYAGLAMAMHEEELVSAVRREDEEEIRYFFEENVTTNDVYASLAELALFQIGLWDIQDEELSSDRVREFSSELVASVRDTFASKAAQEFFVSTSNIQDLRAAEVVYQAALGGVGRDYWISALKKIGYAAQDVFDPAVGIPHVNSRFLNPGRMSADSLFGRQARLCESTERELYGNRFFKLARFTERHIVNPVYALEVACRSFESDGTLGALLDEMATVQNNDYRVVVGHVRDGSVRFSRLSPDELIEVTTDHMQKFRPTKIVKSDEDKSCLGPEFDHFFRAEYEVGEFDSSHSDEGYVYVGSGLSREAALELADHIQERPELRGAYVFRPVDRR